MITNPAPDELEREARQCERLGCVVAKIVRKGFLASVENNLLVSISTHRARKNGVLIQGWNSCIFPKALACDAIWDVLVKFGHNGRERSLKRKVEHAIEGLTVQGESSERPMSAPRIGAESSVSFVWPDAATTLSSGHFDTYDSRIII